jgi:hypothetical protein
LSVVLRADSLDAFADFADHFGQRRQNYETLATPKPRDAWAPIKAREGCRRLQREARITSAHSILLVKRSNIDVA